MTEQETNKILAMITEIYPSFRKDRNPGITSQVWHTVLKDKHYIDVQDALQEFIRTDTKGFPPAPGALLAIADRIGQWDEVPCPLTTGRLIRRAIRHGPEYAEKEFSAFPPEIRNIIGSPEDLRAWAAVEKQQQGKILPDITKRITDIYLQDRISALPSGETKTERAGELQAKQ